MIKDIDVDFGFNPWFGDSGSTGYFRFVNQGDSNLLNWQIILITDSPIGDSPTDLWNAHIISEREDDQNELYEYVIDFPGNQNLEPGESYSFEYNTNNPSPIVTNIFLNDQALDINLPKTEAEPTVEEPSIEELPVKEPTIEELPVEELTIEEPSIKESSIEESFLAKSPLPVSNDAIFVGFEKHSDNTKYNRSAQSRDWNVVWSDDESMNRFTTITDSISHFGNKSLKVTYPSNEQGSKQAVWQLPAQKEYYVSYWIRFDQNFDFDGSQYSGGKLPGLGGAGGLCSGGQTCNGNNGFTSRYMWRENGRAVLYLYHMDKKQKWGDDILLRGTDGEDKYFERGKWHNMIQRLKINDSGTSNGEIEVWMDKEKVLDMDELRFVTNGRGIDQFYFNTFHGGNGSSWWPDQNVDAYFDDFIISTNPADVGL